MCEGGELGGGIRHACQHGRFGEIQCSRGLSVVPLGCCVYAEEARAVVDDIQVHLQNFILGVGEFDVKGEQELLCLAREGLLIREEEIFHELLCDCTCALLDAPILDVDERCASHARKVKTRVLVEPSVLDGDDGFLQFRRDVFDGDIIRTVETCLDGAADEEDARKLFCGIRLADLMQLIGRFLPFCCRQETSELLPDLRHEEKHPDCGQEGTQRKNQEKTPIFTGRFFLSGTLPCRCFAPPLSLWRCVNHCVVHVLLRGLLFSKYFARIRSRISVRLDGSRRML